MTGFFTEDFDLVALVAGFLTGDDLVFLAGGVFFGTDCVLLAPFLAAPKIIM